MIHLLVRGRPVALSWAFGVLGALSLTHVACAAPALDGAEQFADEPASARRDHGTSRADAGVGEVALVPLPSGSLGSPYGADGGTPKGGPGAACPVGAASIGWSCDGFDGAAFGPAWSQILLGGGQVGLRKGGATGTGSFGAGFGTLPAGIGKASLSLALPAIAATSGAGLRFAVKVSTDGYPSRLGIGALRGGGGSAFVLELDGNGTQLVVRDTSGTTPVLTVGTIPFDQWTCVSVELDVVGSKVIASIPGATRSMPVSAARASVALDAVEVGLTYDEGANDRASIGLGFDDVVVGHGVATCGRSTP